MSVRAGSIVMVGGSNVVDRLQRAGLGNAQVPIETIREVGNDLVVDKIPGEADFTFSFESWDVTTDMMAFLNGEMARSPSMTRRVPTIRRGRCTAGRTPASSTS